MGATFVDLSRETPRVYDETPLPAGRVDPDRVRTLVGSLVGSLAFVWLVYTRIAPTAGLVGFTVCWYVTFIVMSFVVARVQWDAVRARDFSIQTVVTASAFLALVPLGSILFTVVQRGLHAFSWSFLTKDMSRAGTLNRLTAGGVFGSLVGTFEAVSIAMLIAVPLGIASAVFLNEIGGRLARPVRLLTDAMSAIPSIVAGLFIYGTVILGLGLSQNAFAGALALALLMLPTITRTAEVVLRLVPGGLREASLALGGTEWRTTRMVVLPTARTGLVTATLLGIARVIGETAPLIITMLGAQNLDWNPFTTSKQDALPLFILTQHKLSTGVGSNPYYREWSGAFVLVGLVLIFFTAARVLSQQDNIFTRTVKGRFR